MSDANTSKALLEAVSQAPQKEELLEAVNPPNGRSKSDQVAKLLRRAKGATLTELQDATSWQPHSVRAFLSSLRKKGSEISKEQRKSGDTAYRLAGVKTSGAASDV